MENFLFELKIRELDLLKKSYTILNDVLILDGDQRVVLGCKHCYMVEPEATANGFKIPKGDLINYNEKYNNNGTVPTEIANKCWLCPVCGSLFRSLLPEFEFKEQNVSI